jgi:hypothetical protein
MPVSKTRYTLQEQYEYHRKHLKQLQTDLARLESAAGASLNYLNGVTNHGVLNNNNNTTTTSTTPTLPSPTVMMKEEKFFDRDKYSYLQFEIVRYTTYANLLEEKLIAEQNSNGTAMMPQINLIGSNEHHHQLHHHQLATNNYNHFSANTTQIASPVYFNSATNSSIANGGHFGTTTNITNNNYSPNNSLAYHHHNPHLVQHQQQPPQQPYQHLNGKTSQASSLSLLNSNCTDIVASKSMPTTPTHLNNNLKNVNFNISPTSVVSAAASAGGNQRTSFTLNDANFGLNPSLSPPPSLSTSTVVTTVTAAQSPVMIVNTPPTLNSTKKFNSYLD